MRNNKKKYRIEQDSLGEYKVPRDAYYGIQTARALDNFPISHWTPHPAFVDATVLIKKSAALVHIDLGLLQKKMGRAIVRASDEILAGQYRDQFVVDVFQAGAGTSHHMNVNEVIANRANEILGNKKKGLYTPIHPNDHVNMAQSTNDVIPTAIRLAAWMLRKDSLGTLQNLARSFFKKAKSWDKIVKSGRTHLQDATPIRLGQEFGAYATSLEMHLKRIQRAYKSIAYLGIGGTAVGTGLNAHPNYQTQMVKTLGHLLGTSFKKAKNNFEAMQSMAPFVELSNALKNLSLDLIRISNDLRLLASGPRTGLGEIFLPAIQPGSSIMPGKVNPVLPEMMNQVCFFSLGLNESIVYASQAGQLELNVMMPLIAYSLTWQITILTRSMESLRIKCIEGMQADQKRCQFYAENSVSLATALSPILGYAVTAEIVKRAIKTGLPLRELLKETSLTEQQIKDLFNLYQKTYPNLKK